MTRDDFLKAEAERVGRRTTMTLVSVGILKWLGGLTAIPEEAVAGARAVLEEEKQGQRIRDYMLHALGPDLLFQVTTLGRGLHDRASHELVYRAVLAAMERARRVGLYAPSGGEDFFKLDARERIVALGLRPLDFPFTERGAEPLFIAKITNGAPGAFNRMLIDLFFPPDKGSHQRLDGTRFVAAVERVGEVRAARAERAVYVFGDRPDEERLFLIYPFLAGPIEIGREHVGDWGEMLSLIATLPSGCSARSGPSGDVSPRTANNSWPLATSRSRPSPSSPRFRASPPATQWRSSAFRAACPQ
jgi:hypothetical protein